MIGLLNAVQELWDIPDCELHFSEAEPEPAGDYAVYDILPIIPVPDTYGGVENKAPVQFVIYTDELYRAAALFESVQLKYNEAKLDIPGFQICRTSQFWMERDGGIWKTIIRFEIIYSREE